MLVGNEVQTPAPEAPALWREHEHAARVFDASLTQLRIGPAGPIGLDYVAVDRVMRWKRVPPRRRRQVFEHLQVMEQELLVWLSAH